MLIYALQRIGLALLICLTSMCLLFAALHVIPGDPVTLMLGSRATPEMRARLQHEMGFDQPVPVQFARFLGRVAEGDLGTDMWTQRGVTTIVLENLPNTLVLIGAALGWAALVGIPLGCYSAIRRNSWIDRLTAILAVGTISIPSFVVAIYALLLFAVELNWFPVIGAGDAGDFGDQIWHLVLPSFAVGLGWVGYLARIVRASMLEVMGEHHIRTARAFGLGEAKIVFHYALRIAILPTVTLLALAIGGLLSSAVFAENIFARPGIGKLIVDAANFRNFPVVQGAVLTTVALFALAMPIADLLVAWLDPRVRSTF
ncbi:MAG TPA: ABC transporter permease [Candidatus Polarisedimenticolia bacterium]|jgi:peptide/nickel transport system permease protein|nr:ABC transporter permease [Dongiaceae bacterium]HYV88078.1 ABC transporter permease [Candidatus Polarisedimenticolia bacterium]